MTKITFVDRLPHSGGKSSKGIWIRRLQPLMERPGTWAIVDVEGEVEPSNLRSAAQHLKNRRYLIPPGKWEFASRKRDGEVRLYARYLGPDEGERMSETNVERGP